MSQERPDTDHQRVQVHINQLISKYLHNNHPAIEHKPGERILLQWLPENAMGKAENTA